MKIIKQKEADIAWLAEELKQGKVIVYPTETCYGLGCDASNQAAVDRLFQIKHRARIKTFLILMSDISMAREYASWTSTLGKIAGKYWPGPLTVVTTIRNINSLAKGVVDEKGMIAFRITGHDFASDLCKTMNRPLVSTSANISGDDNPYEIDNILDKFNKESHQPDIIIDGGQLPVRSPSTIISILGDKIKVLRQGEIIVDIKNFTN